MNSAPRKPLIVGIGGTQRPGSSSELAVRRALSFAESQGAETVMFAGRDLIFQLFSSEDAARTDEARNFVDAVRRADGMIVGSPGYHGSLSGLIKNALDYVEDLRGDERPYLDGRAVGCIAVGFGWQATGSTLAALRSISHALRGWPTPLGVCINSSVPPFAADGSAVEEAIDGQLRMLAGQVVEFAKMRRLYAAENAAS
jgi:FMN reductase